ncbi:MAG: magnesium transporter [Phycisphaerae bacterium]|jgi:magnesium transporter
MKPEQANFHTDLVAALSHDDEAQLSTQLADARAPDIAESFELLSDQDRSRVLFALPSHTAAEVVVMLDEAVRGDVVDDLDTESLMEIVSELPPDDAADMLGELSTDEVAEILGHMTDKQSERIEGLLEYDEETAGGIMTPDVVAVPASKTVADAVEFVREATQEEDLHEIYIVDDDKRLVGTVPLRRLVTSSASTRLHDICESDPVTVYATDDQETVVQVIRKYDVMEAAVVDDNDRLIGRITHDDLLDVAEEEAAEDLFRMAGTDPAEFETSSTFHAARVRLTWLLPCLVGMLLTATVLLVSEARFDAAVFAALASFAPMIGATGGNTGIQISTVIVRGFATGDIGASKLTRAFLREGRIAITMAPVCGLVAWALASLGLESLEAVGLSAESLADPGRVAIAIGAAMTVAVLVAGLLGIILPFTFRKLGVDPAIASGPLVTTTNDVVSVSIYMSLAMLIAG